MEKILIHALAVWREGEGRCKIRATVRSGQPNSGDELWFETKDLQTKKVVIEDVRISPRLSTIALSGEPDTIESLEGGMYLHSLDWKMNTTD